MSQIYLLEVFVWRLNLLSHIIEAAGDPVYIIRINFIDFPTLEITRNDNSFVVTDPPICKRNLDFSAGQACHFSIEPRDLVRAMLKRPLKIGVYRTGDSFPMCFAELPLSGCLCDQVAKAEGDENVPSPYMFCGGFSLTDNGGNPSGSIDVMIRLTCFGKRIVTHYALQRKHFLFKNDLEGAEYKCHRLTRPNRCGDDQVESEDDPRVLWMTKCATEPTEDVADAVGVIEFKVPREDFMRDVAGISPGAGHLSLGKQLPRAPRSPLIPPYVPPPQVSPDKRKGKK